MWNPLIVSSGTRQSVVRVEAMGFTLRYCLVGVSGIHSRLGTGFRVRVASIRPRDSWRRHIRNRVQQRL